MSDQDFFFDEDEAPAEAPAAAGDAKPEPSRARTAVPAATAPAVAGTIAGMQSVSMTVAALFGVVALLVGIIIGILIPAGANTSVPAPTAIGGQVTPAPQLSPEQIEGGNLPPGHPPIEGAGGTTPSGEATAPSGSTPATETE